MARKKRLEEPENHDRWLVSYADFITLLFAFFVVLYATSNRNEEKEKEFQESIRHYMKMFVSVVNPGGSGTAAAPGPVFDSVDTMRRTSRDQRQMEKELQKIIEARLTEKERQELVPDVKSDQHGVRIVLSATAFFPTGSAKMRLPATKALSSLADVLKTTPYRLVVEGHTDNQPVLGGQYETNWELAGARAASVVRFLAKVHGVNPKKMSAVSFADQKPIAENDSEEHRSKNRRIEILIATDNESEE